MPTQRLGRNRRREDWIGRPIKLLEIGGGAGPQSHIFFGSTIVIDRRGRGLDHSRLASIDMLLIWICHNTRVRGQVEAGDASRLMVQVGARGDVMPETRGWRN